MSIEDQLGLLQYLPHSEGAVCGTSGHWPLPAHAVYGSNRILMAKPERDNTSTATACEEWHHSWAEKMTKLLRLLLTIKDIV